MAKTKKTVEAASDAKPIADVAHPGTTTPSDTSKSIITSRPMIKDPMVVEDDQSAEDTKPLTKKTAETKIMPPEEKMDPAPEKPEKTEAEEPVEPEADDEKPDEPDDKPAEAEPDTKPDGDVKADEKDKEASKSDIDNKDAETAARDAKLQQLVDTKKYFLPINAVEHRRSKRVVIGGVVLALLLAVAWADIALDAGLIQVNGVKPVTHFFSS